MEWMTPLHHAAKNGHEGVVRMLLDREFPAYIYDVSLDKFMLTALLMAVAEGHEAIVRLLPEKGANIEASYHLDLKSRSNALHLAVRNGHQRVVRMLIDKKVNINKKFDKWTALHLAAEKGSRMGLRSIAQNVILCRSSRHCPWRFGRDTKVWHVSRREGGFNRRIHEWKMGRGERMTALHLAVVGGHERIARHLVENGAKVNLEYWPDRRTALHLAVDEGHEAIAQLLLENKAEINEETSGFPPVTTLSPAVASGHEGMARLLIMKGANVHKYSRFELEMEYVSGRDICPNKEIRRLLLEN